MQYLWYNQTAQLMISGGKQTAENSSIAVVQGSWSLMSRDRFERRGSPRVLFPNLYSDQATIDWDISSDGGRFLMIKNAVALSNTPAAAGAIVVVQNCFEELTRLVPTKQ